MTYNVGRRDGHGERGVAARPTAGPGWRHAESGLLISDNPDSLVVQRVCELRFGPSPRDLAKRITIGLEAT